MKILNDFNNNLNLDMKFKNILAEINEIVN
jgi:hypothetical protein